MFRTWIQSGWEEWDYDFRREVVQSNLVGLYIPGPLSFMLWGFPVKDRNAPRYHELEAITASLAARQWVTATLLFDAFPDHARPLKRGEPFESTLSVTLRWREMDRLRLRVGWMIRGLRQLGARRVAVFTDDFAARWILGAGADYLAFDAPMLARGEVADLMGRPTIMRQSYDPRIVAWWDLWRLDFTREEWLCSKLPSIGRLGNIRNHQQHHHQRPIWRSLALCMELTETTGRVQPH